MHWWSHISAGERSELQWDSSGGDLGPLYGRRVTWHTSRPCVIGGAAPWWRGGTLCEPGCCPPASGSLGHVLLCPGASAPEAQKAGQQAALCTTVFSIFGTYTQTREGSPSLSPLTDCFTVRTDLECNFLWPKRTLYIDTGT